MRKDDNQLSWFSWLSVCQRSLNVYLIKCAGRRNTCTYVLYSVPCAVTGGFPWLSMVFYGYGQFPMVMHGFLWLSMASMVIHGFRWFSMVITKNTMITGYHPFSTTCYIEPGLVASLAPVTGAWCCTVV